MNTTIIYVCTTICLISTVVQWLAIKTFQNLLKELREEMK